MIIINTGSSFEQALTIISGSDAVIVWELCKTHRRALCFLPIRILMSQYYPLNTNIISESLYIAFCEYVVITDTSAFNHMKRMNLYKSTVSWIFSWILRTNKFVFYAKV